MQRQRAFGDRVNEVPSNTKAACECILSLIPAVGLSAQWAISTNPSPSNSKQITATHLRFDYGA
jgi:hypothetical protein